jgi:23S rRNA pseudouridine1911/1915/1917 synthase
MKKIEVIDLYKKERLDKYLAAQLEESRSTIQYLIKEQLVLVNNEETKANYTIKEGDIITIQEVKEEEVILSPEAIPLDVIYEDNRLLVVNKPSGMVVHPGAGNKEHTLVNALLHHIKDLQPIKGELRPGIVHRIDKETSGLLVVAKDVKSLEFLANQFKEKTASRTYVALVEGVIQHNLGKIDAPVGRDPKNRQKQAVVENGKAAVTHFSVLERFENHTLIECNLETGRTHQIRVHLAYIKHPLVGDPKYGLKKTDKQYGQFLHAKTLGFTHPETKEFLSFDSELPTYFSEYLETLRVG